jgi:hypothetical protein
MMARRRFEPWAVILGSLLAGAAYAWFAGEDTSWDWQNYHEYSAFALINGRFNEDVAPAGIQTFLNPVAYVPAYLLRQLCRRAVLGNDPGLNPWAQPRSDLLVFALAVG